MLVKTTLILRITPIHEYLKQMVHVVQHPKTLILLSQRVIAQNIDSTRPKTEADDNAGGQGPGSESRSTEDSGEECSEAEEGFG